MNKAFQPRIFVLSLLVAALSLLASGGCGGQTDSASTANDPTSQSVSSYEAEIAKSKAASQKKAAK